MTLAPFLRSKRGLFITPIAASFFAMKIWPMLLVGLPPGLLAAVVYRTCKTEGNKVKVFRTSLGVAFLSFLTIRLFVVEVRSVMGDGMSPTIPNGARVLVDKTAYWGIGSPQRGDIVILTLNILRDLETRTVHVVEGGSTPGKISRVIGLPGEQFAIIRGQTMINGMARSEPYLGNIALNPQASINYPLTTIGDSRNRCVREYITPRSQRSVNSANPFFRGRSSRYTGGRSDAIGLYSECFYVFRDDNRSVNSGRLHIGAIPQKNFIGRVKAILWPPEQIRYL